VNWARDRQEVDVGEINKQINIGAPLTTVYTYVYNPRNAPNFISSITRVISGPEGDPSPGQSWKAEADFMGQKRLINLRVAELIPNKIVRFVLEGDPEAVVQLKLTGDKAGDNTSVALSLEANGVPTLFLNALLGGLLAQDMVRLKKLLENSPG